MTTAPGRSTYVLEISGGADGYVVADNDINIAEFWVTNTDADTRYLMAFNATSVPSNGTAPLYSVAVNAGLTAGHSFGPGGAYFDTGLVLALSTDAKTLTITTGSQGVFGALVRGATPFQDN